MGYVKDIKIGSGTPNLIEPVLYGICSTASNVAAKVTSITNFELVIGVTISVLFIYENTAENPTLNEVPIYLNNENISPWDAGETISLTYDGTYWRVNNYGKVEVINLI